jgi:hypothetical protein
MKPATVFKDNFKEKQKKNWSKVPDGSLDTLAD